MLEYFKTDFKIMFNTNQYSVGKTKSIKANNNLVVV